MHATFVHTADWQLGKPFARIDGDEKRRDVQKARFDAITRIGDVAREHDATFVVVAGDLFDSPTATKSTVSQACSLVGRLGVPVYVIPGNHDHGGPGGLWEQDFFRQEQRQLAPNLHVLLEKEPVETDDAVLLPCPLLRRHETTDPTAWLQSLDAPGKGDRKPHIILAHGSVQGFDGGTDDEDAGGGAPNLLDLSRLPAEAIDYIALGDWHGTKQVGEKAWYAGTPEPDRFRKGEGNDPGNVLVVRAVAGGAPDVQRVATGALGWHQLDFHFAGDASLDQFESRLKALLGNRAGGDLLQLSLRGSLGIEATSRLEALLDTMRARLLRLKLADHTGIAPSDDEIDDLTRRPADPLIARVAAQLVDEARGDSDQSVVARLALRELHAACHSESP